MRCKTYLTTLLLLAAGGASARQIPLPELDLLPLPREIHAGEGRGLTWSELTHIVAEGAAMPVLGEHLDRLPRSRRPGPGVRLILDGETLPESEQGYLLELSRRGVTIRSRGEAGLFYGCATLEQLLCDSRDRRSEIPPLRIVDYPAIEFRAVHFDTKHHLDRTEYYYRVIDRLAQYKINAVIWEIEDKLRYARHPICSAPNAISKQEMQALCRYARERHVEIDPLVQGLGHAGFILKHHWHLRENPASDWEFCPSDPRTYELQFDLYRDAIEAMPGGRYLHVGGDEIRAIGIDQRCRATGKTPFELQMMWLEKVCDFAAQNGRIPIVWDDMPLKYARLWHLLHGNLSDRQVEKRWSTERLDQAVGLFPDNCIYMRWHYDDPTILANRKVLAWYREKGLKVMAATAASDGCCPFMPRDDSRALNIRHFSNLVVENDLTGILATAWDDGSPHWETVMRGFAAQGEYGWNPQGRTVEAFKAAHARREFGLDAERMAFLDQLEEAAFFFDHALIVAGHRNPAWQTADFTLLDLPNPEAPGAWSARHAGRLDSARLEAARYLRIREGIERAKGAALRNRYTLEVYEQNNELFHFPVRLLLAIEAWDKAPDETERLKAETTIRTVCDSFDPMRARLEEVYSRTRFMQAPEGYVADLNHHRHLSALTLDSDWLYLYEIPYIRKVESWLDR